MWQVSILFKADHVLQLHKNMMTTSQTKCVQSSVFSGDGCGSSTEYLNAPSASIAQEEEEVGLGISKMNDQLVNPLC
jgi:pyruvate/2-oxoacid:ferredoxin oxidoreductase beta subunit